MQLDRLTDYGLEAICGDVSDGLSLTKIASNVGVSLGTLLNWMNANPERSARVREARSSTAQLWDERAEQVLQQAEDAIDVQKARELASHYRWRASKIAPKTYGDRLELAGEIGVKEIPDDRVESRIAILLRTAGAVGAIGGAGAPEEAPEDTRLLPGDGTAET